MASTLRLYEYFLPRHYDLTLTIEREKRVFHGRVVMSGHKPHAAHPIMVHAKDLTIQAAMVGDTLVPTTPLTHDAVQIGDGLPAGSYDITLEFSGRITDPMHGLYPCYYVQDGDKKELLATQFESHHAREVFPCIDEPEAKATFDVTLITEPGVTVLSNMPEKKDEGRRTKEAKTTSFETTPRMSTYLLAWVIGDLHHTSATSHGGTTVNVYSTKAQPTTTHRYALREAVSLLDFYEDYFDAPYPLAKCDHVALPDFSALAMENWGLITYREGYLLVNDTTPLSQQQYISTVIAHELTHQWFGNLVTMRWWDDLWLNESFANLMEYVALDHVHPDWLVWEEFASSEIIHALSRDQFADIQPVSYTVKTPDDIAVVFDKAILYCKGSRLLGMLMHHVGEADFRRGLRQYFETFAYGNTEGHDLWHILSAVSGKRIETFMDTWLTQAGLPVVNVSEDNAGYRVTQQRLAVGGRAQHTLWPIPLAAADEHFPHILHEVFHDDIAAASPQLNRAGVAHFVTHYEPSLFIGMREKLRAGQLSTVERLLLAYETYLLTMNDNYTSEQCVALLGDYRHETSSAVWIGLASILERLRSTLEQQPLAAREAFNSWAASLALPTMTVLGYAPRKAETPQDAKCRGTLYKLLVQSCHPATIEQVLAAAATTSDLTHIDGMLQPAVFLAMTTHGHTDDIGRLFTLYASTHDAHLREVIGQALAHSRHHDTTNRLLHMLGDSSLIKLQDTLPIFAGLIRNPVSRGDAWAWMTNHWEWLCEHFGGGHSLEKIPIACANAGTTRDWLEQYQLFFTTQHRPEISRATRVGINELTARVMWVESHATALARIVRAPET